MTITVYHTLYNLSNQIWPTMFLSQQFILVCHFTQTICSLTGFSLQAPTYFRPTTENSPRAAVAAAGLGWRWVASCNSCFNVICIYHIVHDTSIYSHAYHTQCVHVQTLRLRRSDSDAQTQTLRRSDSDAQTQTLRRSDSDAQTLRLRRSDAQTQINIYIVYNYIHGIYTRLKCHFGHINTGINRHKKGLWL